MPFKTDSGGWVFGASEWKLSLGASTWATRLSQLNRQSGVVRLLTYSLPSMSYVTRQFSRRPKDIWVICHSKFEGRALELKSAFPDIRIAVHDSLHAKVLTIEPATVWLGSANFGDSGWVEVMAGIRSKPAHDHCVENFDQIWAQSRELR
jgi:phosphatidylserine/phosphatidylglycerophosphate/cardiolipin synthase-like enzyme